MKREELQKEIAELLRPYPGTETMYEGDNVVAAFLSDQNARSAILRFASQRNYKLAEIGSSHLVVCQRKRKSKTLKKEVPILENQLREIEVFGATEVIYENTHINKIDQAIKSLMAVDKDVPHAACMQSATEHTILRLQNVRDQLTKTIYV